jgi:hypothetical protein
MPRRCDQCDRFAVCQIDDEEWLCSHHLRVRRSYRITKIGFCPVPEIVCSMLTPKEVDWEEYDYQLDEMAWENG